jgi:hypothetical protein
VKALLLQFRDFFVSLRLTVWLLALSIVLIFWATLSQADLGVWGIQEKFFRTFFVLQKIPGTDVPVPVYPGGYFLGGLLLLNLIAAHLHRFRLSWRQSGIWLTHLGLILLLVGGFLSSIMQQEFQLRLEEGHPKNYSESNRETELAIVDKTDPHFDDVVVIPEGMLARGDPVQHPKLPFRVVLRGYFPNADLQTPGSSSNLPPSLATQGPPFVRQLVPIPLPLTYKENERNLPAAYVELVGPDGSLGIWLVSAAFAIGNDNVAIPQHFSYAGHDWEISLRFRRRYLPFSLTLLKFSHDIYPGTDVPKNFSSRVRLETSGGGGSREALIYMNNPLRTAGLTFYQASFEPGNERATILQVVRNPSWRLPYVACSMMALGLIIQFGRHLAGFARRQRAVAA